jgi:hypothetical protein
MSRNRPARRRLSSLCADASEYGRILALVILMVFVLAMLFGGYSPFVAVAVMSSAGLTAVVVIDRLYPATASPRRFVLKI